LTALRPELFWNVDEELIVNPEEIPLGAVRVFKPDEFQYIKLGLCGPSFCREKWHLSLSAYFKPSGALFGLSRILADFSLPIMANLTVDVGLSAPVGGLASLAVGWTFTF